MSIYLQPSIPTLPHTNTMRASAIVLALPALACAQQQVPLVDQVKGWFAKASDTISSAIPSTPQSIPVPDPVASAAKAVAALNVHKITVSNYKDILVPGAATASPGLEEWMVFSTGANKTCMGKCERAETAWNESIALISASSSPPNLGLIDCEADPVLCLAWAIRPATVLHFLLPQPLSDQSTPATTFRPIYLNRTTVTAPEIAAIHLEEKYKEKEVYEGIFHPFDGPLAKYGLTVPAGYVLWGFNQSPSWLFMVVISMGSRTLMSRRAGIGRDAPARGGPAPPAAS